MLSWPYVISQYNNLVRRIQHAYIHTCHIYMFAYTHPCPISIFHYSLYKRGRTTNWVINTSIHTKLISPITCEYIFFSKYVSRETDFLTHHVGMMSLLQHKVISSIIGNLTKHNKVILTLHFIYGPEEHNSFISPYLCKYHP